MEHKAYVCTECLISNHMGHQVVPAKPLILGEVTNDILTNVARDTETLKQNTFAHLEAVVLKQKQSNGQIEGVSLALIKEIQTLVSRMVAENEQHAGKITEESAKRVDTI